MSSDSVARHYAEAIFGIGKAKHRLSLFQSNAEDFGKLLNQSKDLSLSLSHPNLSRGQRRGILDAVLLQSDYDPLFKNFLRVVVERGRIGLFKKILSEFIVLRDAFEGRLRGKVYSAVVLSPAQRAALLAKVQSKLSCEVILEEYVDASVIGGLRIEINGRVYDDTVRHQLEMLQDRIINVVQ